MAKKKAKKKSSSKKGSGEMLLVTSKVKAQLKAQGVNVAGDALVGLNSLIHWYIHQACGRAQANGRKTVRSHDFLIM